MEKWGRIFQSASMLDNMKFKKIKFKRKIINLEKIARRLAENSSLTFFILLIIILVLSGLVYYQYVISVQSSLMTIKPKPLETQEKTYQKILDEWTKRNEIFLQADFKEYPDLFQPATSTSTPE